MSSRCSLLSRDAPEIKIYLRPTMNCGTSHTDCINDLTEAILERSVVKAHRLLAP